MHTPKQTGNGTVESTIQTLKNLVLANLEDGNILTESVNRAIRVMRFTVHTGLKKTLFELHHHYDTCPGKVESDHLV